MQLRGFMIGRTLTNGLLTGECLRNLPVGIEEAVKQETTDAPRTGDQLS